MLVSDSYNKPLNYTAKVLNNKQTNKHFQGKELKLYNMYRFPSSSNMNCMGMAVQGAFSKRKTGVLMQVKATFVILHLICNESTPVGRW